LAIDLRPRWGRIFGNIKLAIDLRPRWGQIFGNT